MSLECWRLYFSKVIQVATLNTTLAKTTFRPENTKKNSLPLLGGQKTLPTRPRFVGTQNNHTFILSWCRKVSCDPKHNRFENMFFGPQSPEKVMEPEKTLLKPTEFAPVILWKLSYHTHHRFSCRISFATLNTTSSALPRIWGDFGVFDF